MTPIAWVVEHSLQDSERFRHLTVKPTIEMQIAAYLEWKRKEDRNDQGLQDKLRAELAGKAMQGMLSDVEVMRAQLEGEEGKLVNQVIAKEAVAFADALMKELGLGGE